MTDERALERRRELSGRVGRAIHLPMLALAVVFLIALVLPELIDLPPAVEDGLEAVNWLIWAAFAFELLVMTYLAENRRRYLVTHWIDVLTVLLPILRPFHLLRVAILSVRLWTEARYLIRQRALSVATLTGLLCIWVAATLVYMAEKGGDGTIQTYPDALWWAVATITTVGYGDVYPKTYAGRGVAFLLMLGGISVFGLVTARVAAFFVESEARDAADAGHDETQAKLDEILARLARIERDGPRVDSDEAPSAQADPPRTSSGA